MFIISNKTDASLEYVIKDCAEAISANPLGPKTVHYYELAKRCEVELFRRERKRCCRKSLLNSGKHDILSLPLKDRKMYSGYRNMFYAIQNRISMQMLGIMRLDERERNEKDYYIICEQRN